ncbi:hypothetical protein P7C71_g2641, partial [Lecanoromycetidae sp. Uapishka_2]
MRSHQLLVVFTSLTVFLLAVTGLFTLRGHPPGSSPKDGAFSIKRQPITPPDQTLVTPAVPVPGQQTQNTTSTAGSGNGTDPSPGVVTNSATTTATDEVDSVNQFFYSWWTAVGNAASVASDNVDQIVQLLDPLSATNTVLDDVLLTLTGVFALVPGLGYLTKDVEGFTEGWVTFAQVFENALFVVPQIGRWLFPIDSETSQVIQMAALKTEMVSIIQTVQDNLNKTIVSVMTNATEFLAFASQGNFSTSAPSLPDQTNYLLYAFNTYIISQALNGNNVYGVFAQDTNPQALATNGSKTAYDFSDCKGYNEQNVCDEWWYSSQYSSAFGLDDFSHMTRTYGDVLTTLFSNYTTGELLFDGAYACNANGNYGQPVNITVNSAGVNTGCLSQLRIVTWDMACDNPTKYNGCEFLEIPRQGQFFGDCNSHSVYSDMDEPIYCVPASYLGPLVAQKDIQLKRD